MRVMLMLCVKEKIFDNQVLEQIFAQWLQCEVLSTNFSPSYWMFYSEITASVRRKLRRG
jgi:hypothetical protein